MTRLTDITPLPFFITRGKMHHIWEAVKNHSYGFCIFGHLERNFFFCPFFGNVRESKTTGCPGKNKLRGRVASRGKIQTAEGPFIMAEISCVMLVNFGNFSS